MDKPSLTPFEDTARRLIAEIREDVAEQCARPGPDGERVRALVELTATFHIELAKLRDGSFGNDPEGLATVAEHMLANCVCGLTQTLIIPDPRTQADFLKDFLSGLTERSFGMLFGGTPMTSSRSAVVRPAEPSGSA